MARRNKIPGIRTRHSERLEERAYRKWLIRLWRLHDVPIFQKPARKPAASKRRPDRKLAETIRGNRTQERKDNKPENIRSAVNVVKRGKDKKVREPQFHIQKKDIELARRIRGQRQILTLS